MSPYGRRSAHRPRLRRRDQGGDDEGRLRHLQASLKDNKGAVVVSKNLDQFDPSWEDETWSSVVGSIPG